MLGHRRQPVGRVSGLLERGAALHLRPSRLPAVAAVAFAAVLVAYGNSVSALPEAVSDRYEWAIILGNLSLMMAALAWAARGQGLTFAEIGLARRRLLAGSALGAGLAALVIIPVVIYFAFPVGVPGGEIDYDGVNDHSWGTFLLWALVRQPIGTSLFEETVFRGILQALALRAYGLLRGLFFVALAFALWHLVVNFRTVQETSLVDNAALTALAQLASMAGLIVGSLFMSMLRQRSGSLAAPMAFHWLTVVAMQGTLFAAD